MATAGSGRPLARRAVRLPAAATARHAHARMWVWVVGERGEVAFRARATRRMANGFLGRTRARVNSPAGRALTRVLASTSPRWSGPVWFSPIHSPSPRGHTTLAWLHYFGPHLPLLFHRRFGVQRSGQL